MWRNKIFIGLLVIIALVYILYNSEDSAVQNTGKLTLNQEFNQARPEIIQETDFIEEKVVNAKPRSQRLRSSPDPAVDDSWVTQFNDTNNVIESGQKSSNSDFRPYDETNNAYADFMTKKMVKGPPFVDERKREDSSFDPELYNAENLLPQERHPDWFEVIEEPISVKNRHLISLQQPIGINTVGQSLKNANRDLRAAPANPKMVVGPWLQSTIEPDYNTKSLC